MDTVDYIYRFDPKNPSLKLRPRDADTARRALEDGNRLFSRWTRQCRGLDDPRVGPHLVVQCNGQEVGLVGKSDQSPEQAPFAVVVGCSDARVPMELLFGQGFNDLFVVRVAGNVMGSVCQGSVDFALSALAESLKVIVVLGHSGCGAVTAAVDSYLDPAKFRAKTTSTALRTIQEHLFIAVREAANGLQEIWGDDASTAANYRSALIDNAIALNAAQSAYDLRQDVERAGKPAIEVLFGVFSLLTHQVGMPIVPIAPFSDENVRLAHAPSDPSEFPALARQLAQLHRAKRP